MQAHLFHLARLVSTDHERLVEGARQMLAGLAQLREVRDRDARGCSAIFADLLRQYPVYANLGAIGPDGLLFCSGLPILSAIHLADRAYFRRAVQTRDFAVGDYQVGRATGKATINFAYPVLDDRGQVRTVVFAAMDLASLNHLSARARWPKGSTVTVLDSTGIVLARHPDPETWVGRFVHDAPLVRTILGRGGEGTVEARGLEGTPRLFAFTPLGGLPPDSPVYVVLGISKDAAFAEIDRALRRNLVGMAVVTILALAAAWLIGGWFILNRVKGLVNATRRLAAGDLSARTSLSYDGELGELARAFDEMAGTLQVRQAEARQTEEELRRQREALFQSEKLAAMGQLLAGVAHELNNPLSVVLGRAALLREGAGDGPLRVQIEKIANAAERCARIVRNFLALARQQPTERQRVGLNQVVQEAVELLAYPLRVDGVEVTLDLDCHLPILWADPHQLHQLVVNLVSNAHHAMRGAPPPRRLSIRTRSGSRDRVSLEVADTGPGIPPEVQSRIFEPFFTTKPQGQGTGLGLPLCLGIVEAHGGSMRVESRPGAGAVFLVDDLLMLLGSEMGYVASALSRELGPRRRGLALGRCCEDHPERERGEGVGEQGHASRHGDDHRLSRRGREEGESTSPPACRAQCWRGSGGWRRARGDGRAPHRGRNRRGEVRDLSTYETLRAGAPAASQGGGAARS